MMNFKKISIVAALCVLLLVFGESQLTAQEFNAGVNLGLNATQVDGDSYGGYSKLGLTGGLFVSREIIENLNWQLELKYSNRGAISYARPGDLAYDKAVYHYLCLPLSINYIFNEHIQTELGLSPEVLIAYAAYDNNGLLDPSLYPDNRRFGLSGFAGIHYWYTSRSAVGLRFTYSLVSFRDPRDYYVPQWWIRGYHHNILSLEMMFRIFQP